MFEKFPRQSNNPVVQAALYTAAIVGGLCAPIVLLPIVRVAGHSIIFEEISKAMIILLLSRVGMSRQNYIAPSILVGISFGISESVLYLNNAFAIGVFDELWYRVLLTTPLHGLTTLIFAWMVTKNRYFLLPAILFIIALHVIFNIAVKP